MSLSSDQHTDRLNCITATDVPAILGLHPFRSPLDVWLGKVGKAAPDPGSDRTKWGDLLEPVIRDDYATRHGVMVRQVGTLLREVRIAVPPPADSGVVTFAATPDGLVGPDTHGAGLEIKTHSAYAADYGRPGTDEVPHHIMIQCQIGMFVTGMLRWDLVAFYDGLPHDYVIRYDEDLVNAAVKEAASWWRRHVVAHVMPTPDGSKATERTIRGMLPGTNRPMKEAKWLDPRVTGHMGAIEHLRYERACVAAAVKNYNAGRQFLELAIGDHDGFEWQEGGKTQRVSWRRSADKSVVDYRAALADWRTTLDLHVSVLETELEAAAREPALLAVSNLVREVLAGPNLSLFTTTKPGSRRFLVPKAWGPEDDEEGGES